MRNEFIHYSIIFCLVLAVAGCKDDLQLSADGIGEHEAVTFTTYVPGNGMTRAEKSDAQKAFETRMGAYRAVEDDYEFTIEMYEEDVAEALGTGTYKPLTTETVTNAGTPDEATVTTYSSDGTLTPLEGSAPLYWPGNAKPYGFKAMAGVETMEGVLPAAGGTIKVVNQTTQPLLLKYDRLVGYGFEPLWDATTENVGTSEEPVMQEKGAVDNETGLNYRTAKQWYAANQRTYGMVPEGEDPRPYYKKIPLYLQHQRALITIRLKAGEGVKRSDLTFDHAIGDEDTDGHIETIVYSYDDDTDTHQHIQPLAQKTTIDYDAADPGGEATGVETTEYTCIVEPHDYLSGTAATSDTIARINLSGQHFTFYASNDFKYNDYKSNVADAVAHMEGYNLKAGQHLVIPATLGRGSRKILITAYVEDWTEAVTTSIVDDYGKSGDPIQINSRKELYDFLRSDKNKAGNVAIIVPNSLNLEMSEGADCPWNYNTDDDSSNDLSLYCTLNMAGATFRTDHQIFSTIHPMGNLVNGTITVGNSTVPAAIAYNSMGTLERINVLPRDVSGNSSGGKASRAGLVVTNSGTITQCHSELPVHGLYDTTEGSKANVVGGIAAYSVYSEDDRTMPVIDGCIVNARVSGEMIETGEGDNKQTLSVIGGGIVGEAAGRVTNNTFAYGITLLQDATSFKNIIHHKVDLNAESPTLRAYGNAWPTTANNNNITYTQGDITQYSGIPADHENGTTEADRYDAVIDSQVELAALLSTTHNLDTKRYRLSGDFTVTKVASAENNNTGWTFGQQSTYMDATATGNVFFKLDGGNHTITTDAMLFSNVQNDISNITIRLGGNLIASSSTGGAPEGQEAIAPLAYSVSNGATISNIQVKGGDYRIQAPTVGGLVVWAFGGATIQDCQCKASIQVWMPNDPGKEARQYTGGIVAEAARATITRCVYHSSDKTLFRNKSSNYLTAENDYTDKTANIYYGGILGGTVRKNEANGGTGEDPLVIISDCSSWFTTSDNEYKGAIVGFAQYADYVNNSIFKPGTVVGEQGSQGNWWRTGSNAVGTGYDTLTDEEIIGKRNAVTPTENTNY